MIVEEYSYTQLQDDGCPNCPEHLGDIVPVFYITPSLPSLHDWLNIDNKVLNSIRARDRLYNDVLGTR